jgi:hypothetical protein
LYSISCVITSDASTIYQKRVYCYERTRRGLFSALERGSCYFL